MANEVPGVVVPPAVLDRMQRASARGKEAGLAEGIAIARETLERIRSAVQGIQVSAPFGRVDFALQVYDGVPGIDPNVELPDAEQDALGFSPPWQGHDRGEGS